MHRGGVGVDAIHGKGGHVVTHGVDSVESGVGIHGDSVEIEVGEEGEVHGVRHLSIFCKGG